MHKFLTNVAALFLVTLAAAGCGKKEAAQEEQPQAMLPITVSVDSAPSTNLVTKAGTPVEAGTPMPAETAVSEPAQAAAYTAPTPEEIQQALKNAGLYTGSVDGKIGPMTKKAIVDFQKQNGLVADGKVGSKTWERLKAHLNQQ